MGPIVFKTPVQSHSGVWTGNRVQSVRWVLGSSGESLFTLPTSLLPRGFRCRSVVVPSSRSVEVHVSCRSKLVGTHVGRPSS